MSYLVLARKYRPKVFEDVVGQEVVTGILRGAIEEQRVGHAYLFSGPRGTGKTTTARIFAKALNCERGPAPNPCGECARCLAADDGSDLDLIEIDAASNTSVNDVRELREQVVYAPSAARFKVYLIDEVHMLSKAAFNALLKTLEEPPAHVKFLFATTEPHKVIDTILSRVQVLRLSAIREEHIAGRLSDVFKAEGVEAEDGVVQELARRARGGMRDALSMADQLLALAGASPRVEDLARLSGSGPAELEALLRALLDGDRKAALETAHAHAGRESELISSLLDHLRQSLLAMLAGPDSPLIEGGPEAGAAALALGKEIGPERLELFMSELLRARERLRLLAGSERVVVELTLLDLAREETTLPLLELEARLAAMEARLESGAPASTAPAAARAKPAPASSPQPQQTKTQQAKPQPARTQQRPAPPASAPDPQPPTPERRAPSAPRPAGAAGDFDALVNRLRERSPSLAELVAREGRLDAVAGAPPRLVLAHVSPADGKLVRDTRNRRTLERALSDTVPGAKLQLDDDAPTPAAASEQTEPSAQEDPFTREVADLFGGRIEESR